MRNLVMQDFLDSLPRRATSDLIDYRSDAEALAFAIGFANSIDDRAAFEHARRAVADELNIRIPPRSES